MTRRWEYGVPPRLESELAWVQHALAHAGPGGTVVMLMPPAAAARPSGRRIRSRLLQAGALRAVISLPPRLAAHYALALQVWVLTKPGKDHAHSPVLMVDASGFSALPGSRRGAADAVPTWDEVRALVTRAWTTFTRADPAARSPPSSDVAHRGSRHRPPRRGRRPHSRPPPAAVPVSAVSQGRPGRPAHHLASPARRTGPHLLPDVPPRPPREAVPREASLEELAQTGALFIRRAAPRPAEESKDLPASGRGTHPHRPRHGPGGAAVREDEVIDDEVRNPRVREGDVLVPHVARQLIARVARARTSAPTCRPRSTSSGQTPPTIDPWFLAGLLSSSDGGRQAARMASTLGDHIRFDPRRVRMPATADRGPAGLRRGLPPALGFRPHPPGRPRRGHRPRPRPDRRDRRLDHGGGGHRAVRSGPRLVVNKQSPLTPSARSASARPAFPPGRPARSGREGRARAWPVTPVRPPSP